MQDKRKILNIEKYLGFKFDGGISRKKEVRRIPSLKAWLEEIDNLKEEFVDFTGKQLSLSVEFEDRCDDIFEEYAKDIWPPSSVDRSGWLVDANVNNRETWYPRNLYFEDEVDREGLRKGHYELLYEKVLRYHENEQQHSKRDHSKTPAPSEGASGSSFAAEVEHSKSYSEHHDIDYSGYIEPRLLQQRSQSQQASSEMTMEPSHPQQIVPPVAPMMSTDTASSALPGVCTAETRSSGDCLTTNGFPQSAESASDRSSLNSSAQDMLNQTSSSDKTSRPPSKVGNQKRPRAKDSDSEYTLRNPRKRVQVASVTTNRSPSHKYSVRNRSARLESVTTSALPLEDSKSASSPMKEASGNHNSSNFAVEQEDKVDSPESRQTLSTAPGGFGVERDLNSSASRVQSQSKTSPKHRGQQSAVESCESQHVDTTTTQLEDGISDKQNSSIHQPSLSDNAAPNTESSNLENRGPVLPLPRMLERERSYTAQASSEVDLSKTSGAPNELTSVMDGERQQQGADTRPGDSRSLEYPSPAPTSTESVGVISEMQTHQPRAPRPDEPKSALERARISVYWDSQPDFPDFLVLRRCKTVEDLFAQLRALQPDDLRHRTIKTAKIGLINAEAVGITESPNCRINEEYGEDAFEYLTEILSAYNGEVRPKLKVTVEFWN